MPSAERPSLEELLAALRDERFDVRSESLEVLATRGDAARSALPSLLAMLADPVWQVRSAAARALSTLSPGDAQVRQALLTRALRDAHLWVRHAALAGLALPGSSARDIQAPLLEALSGADAPVDRLRAIQALSRLKLFSEPVLQALVGAAKDVDWAVRAEAVRELGRSGRRVPHGVRVVREALRDGDPTVRETACEALVKLAPLSPEDFEALVQTATDAEPQVRIACAKALVLLPTRAHGETLRALLRDADERVREATVVSLSGPGRYSLPATLWMEYLEDPSPTVRQAAESVLAEESRPDIDIDPTLVDSLRDSPRMGSGVVHLLRSTGVRDSALLEPLARTFLGMKNKETRDVAAHLAAADEPTGLPPVLEGLRHPHVRVRQRAARALGFFALSSATASQGVRVLDQALRDPSERVRQEVTESLGRMGPRALSAYPGLLRRAFEHTHFVPRYARRAVHDLRAVLTMDWDAYPHSSLEPAETLFGRLSGNLSRTQAEQLSDICLARERWHLRHCHPPLESPSPAPCELPEASARAVRAAVVHGTSRRRQTSAPLEARDREREFVWLLERLHIIGLGRFLTDTVPT